MIRKRSRISSITLLGIVILAGLVSRVYGSSLPHFVANNAGDALWTVAVYLSLAIVLPRSPAIVLGTTALGISVLVEVSQLLHFASLDALRATLPGKLLLGSGFLVVDLLRYLLGAILATAVDLWFASRQEITS